jgi:hypothetical protein
MNDSLVVFKEFIIKIQRMREELIGFLSKEWRKISFDIGNSDTGRISLKFFLETTVLIKVNFRTKMW